MTFLRQRICGDFAVLLDCDGPTTKLSRVCGSPCRRTTAAFFGRLGKLGSRAGPARPEVFTQRNGGCAQAGTGSSWWADGPISSALKRKTPPSRQIRFQRYVFPFSFLFFFF